MQPLNKPIQDSLDPIIKDMSLSSSKIAQPSGEVETVSKTKKEGLAAITKDLHGVGSFKGSVGERFKKSSPSPIQKVLSRQLRKIAEKEGQEIALNLHKTMTQTRNKRMPKVEVLTLKQLHKQFEVAAESFSFLKEDEEIMVLWRGCRADKFVEMVKNKSAGNQIFDPNAKAPNEQECLDQVGELGTLPEFTSKPEIARQFGRGSIVAVFAVPVRYLIPGSVSEKGFVCNHNAPAVLLAWEEGSLMEKK